MVRIRLSRGGSKKKPFYSIVVADGRAPRDGKFIEKIGFYNPVAKGQEVQLSIDIEVYEKWESNGAQASDTVKALYKKHKKASQEKIETEKKAVKAPKSAETTKKVAAEDSAKKTKKTSAPKKTTAQTKAKDSATKKTTKIASK